MEKKTSKKPKVAIKKKWRILFLTLFFLFFIRPPSLLLLLLPRHLCDI